MPIVSNLQDGKYTVVSPEIGFIAHRVDRLTAKQAILNHVQEIPIEQLNRILDKPASDGEFRAAWVEAQRVEVENLTDVTTTVAVELDSKTVANQERIQQLEKIFADALQRPQKRAAEVAEIVTRMSIERERLLDVMAEAEGGSREDYIALVDHHLKNSNLSARLEELRGAL